MELYQKWLKENTEYLNKQGTHYLLCRTGKLNDDDLLIFELGERTYFVWLENKTDTSFWLGDIEKNKSLFSFAGIGCIPFSSTLKQVLHLHIDADKRILETTGSIVKFGKPAKLNELKRKFFIKSENRFAYKFY